MQTKSGANCNQLYHTLESVHSVQPSLIPDSSCSEETGTSHLTKSKEISFANTTKKFKSAELIDRLGLLCRQGSINYYLFSGYGNSQRPSLPDHKRSRRNQRIVHAISSLQSKVIRTALSSLYCTLWSVWLEELPPTSRSLLVLLLSSLCPLETLFFALIDRCDWYGFGFRYSKEIPFAFYNSLSTNAVNSVFTRNSPTYSFVWIAANKSENLGHSRNKSSCIRIRLIFRWNPTVLLLNVRSPALQSTYVMYAFLKWRRLIQGGWCWKWATEKRRRRSKVLVLGGN